ncbi:hypothetical protein E2C01_030546 [Portunus trituberculatus]|uniref:Secreted protein n=1 Tax=Portunus trituberculatus TaxID=210409 RepID=A0A5B7EXM2_PORTR|nr:hypothetical protein [Portunus trituberculatus]
MVRALLAATLTLLHSADLLSSNDEPHHQTCSLIPTTNHVIGWWRQSGSADGMGPSVPCPAPSNTYPPQGHHAVTTDHPVSGVTRTDNTPSPHACFPLHHLPSY